MKLSSIKLNGSVDLLNDQEMKMTTGGYGYSSYCYGNEYLFNCMVSFTGGGSVSGKACATSAAVAKSNVTTTYVNFGNNSSDINVTCS
jgi:hypothetical protein